MATTHLPPGFQTVTPYLAVRGAEKLLDFLKRAFDAEELDVHWDGASIAHAVVQIGDSRLEVSEASESWPATPGALHVYVPDCDATHAQAVEAGATVLHSPMDQPYCERSSAVRDLWGNNWYIATYTGGGASGD